MAKAIMRNRAFAGESGSCLRDGLDDGFFLHDLSEAREAGKRLGRKVLKHAATTGS